MTPNTTERTPARVTAVDQKQILALYEAGHYLTALKQLEPFGGLDALTGPAGRALAGRLANNLGAERYGRAIHWRAWQKTPDVESLGFYAAFSYLMMKGPVAALKLCADMPREKLSPTGRADILSAETTLLATLRDFERAERAIDEACALAPQHAWLQVVRGQVHGLQDRTENALAAYQDALRLQPYFRPAVQSMAETLMTLNRVDEARTFLVDAASHMESGLILIQLAQIERELNEHESARERCRLADALLPLRSRDRVFRKWFAGVQSTMAYDCGDIDQAIALAREADSPYYKSIADHLSEHGRTGKRVVLNVGFTLQHDATCVPATLSTLTEYWKMPLAHLDIAEAICYDGTPAHAEREWLEKHGFFCREFTLTWDATRALINAGLPFTQTLVGYSAGHMQAVIGYDSRRGLLVIRDPNVRQAIELPEKDLIEQMRSSGPRGMVFVPVIERQRIEAIELPDWQLWEFHYDLARRLEKHDRQGAWAAYEKMTAAAPDHRLTTYGRARIAWYDGDRHALGECTDNLLAQFPNDQNQWSVTLRLLRENGTREQRLKVLTELNDKKECTTVFRHQFVEELLDDPAQRDEARRLLRRHLHAGAVDGYTFGLMSRLLWAEGKRAEGLQWLRYAACLDDKDESRAMSYFFAARALNSSDEVVQMLRDRFARFRKRSGSPGRSLAEALDQLYQPQYAVEVLQKSLKSRPDDSALKLYAAEFMLRVGRHADAQRLLAVCKATCHPAEWNTAAARLALAENRLEQAWEHAEQSLKIDPLNLGTQTLAANVLADLRGAAAAIEHLKKCVERFPENLGLRALLVERAGEFDHQAREEEARALLALHPHDAWGWRELGFSLVEQRRWQEAHKAATKAHELDPNSEAAYHLFGMIFRGLGKHDKAFQAVLRGVRLFPDSPHAIIELMKLCDTQAERRNALNHVLAEMKRQPIRGDGMVVFRDQAAITFEPADTLRMLLEARKARPDLWQTWSAVVRQLLAMKRTDDALKYAKTAAERFPLLPPSLIDLADVHLQLEQPAEERATLDRALAIDSRNGQTLRRSAEAYHRTGDVQAEKAALERACASEPRNVTHQGALAELLWAQGQRAEAMVAIGAAIRREPRYEWGWRQFSVWAWTIGEPRRMVDMAAEVTKSRPNSPDMWLQRARILRQFPEHSKECLESIDRAIKLDPRSVDAHELRAIVLAERGDFAAALAACHPKTLGVHKPLQLACQAAVIEYQRGNRPAAIEQMRRVCEQDPHSPTPWARLSDWLKEEGKQDESLECARRLTEVAPDSAISWGYAADSLLAAGKRDEAIQHLQKSIQLDPAYMFGGQTLLSLQLEDKQYAAALDTLKIMGPHLSQEERHAKEARVNCLAGKIMDSLRSFQSACETNLENAEQLLEAVDALLQFGQTTNVKELLFRASERPNSSPHLGRVIVEILAREGALSAIEEFCDSLDPAGEIWAEAAATYAEVLGDAQATQKLAGLMSRYNSHLRRRNISWAAVGSALQRSTLYDDARAWMHDWRERPDLEIHMLLALATSLVALDQSEEAIDVAKLAASLPIAPATDGIRLFGACAEVIRDNSSAANERLDSIRPTMLPPYYANMFTIVKCACGHAKQLDEGVGWKVVERAWKTTHSELSIPAGDDLFSHVLSRCERLLLRRRPNVPGKWFAMSRARSAERARRRQRQSRQLHKAI